MRKTIAVIVACALLSGCGSSIQGTDPNTKVEKTYPSIGLFDMKELESVHVCYTTDWWNVAGAIIFIETGLIPIYIVGWHLWKPVRMKKSPTDGCGIDS